MRMTSGAHDLSAPAADSHLELRVITPHSGLEGFRSAIASLSTGFRSARELAWRFFIRDTRADHRQSLLGYVWLIVPVLANTLTWVFLKGQGIVGIDSGPIPYALFVLAGVILWGAFNGAVMAMLNVVNPARSFLAKVNFPHEALIYSAVLKATLDAVLAALLIIPAAMVMAPAFSPRMFLYPVALAGSLLAGSALGLMLLPVAALYTDISRAVQLVLRFGFFFTPVIFPLPQSGMARQIMLLNPATPIVATGRSWLTGSIEAMPGAFVAVVGVSALLILTGILFYKVSMPHIIERLGG